MRICSHCFQNIKEGEKTCSLCKAPYVPPVAEEDSKPIIERPPPGKLHLPKGVLAIIISAVVAIGIGAFGILRYINEPETAQRAALDGINILLNADIRGFAARHAFMEDEIRLAIRSRRAASWDDAILPLIWEKYNELEKVLDILEKGDIVISVSGSEELKDIDRNAALDSIYYTITADSYEDPARTEMVESIINNIERVYRVDIEVSAVNAEASQDALIIVHVGMLGGSWAILSETLA
jgi:hypothetical protein